MIIHDMLYKVKTWVNVRSLNQYFNNPLTFSKSNNVTCVYMSYNVLNNLSIDKRLHEQCKSFFCKLINFCMICNFFLQNSGEPYL